MIGKKGARLPFRAEKRINLRSFTKVKGKREEKERRVRKERREENGGPGWGGFGVGGATPSPGS